jgi:hypothetical protein
MIRTVYLTPEEVRGAIVQRAEREVTEPEGDLYDEKVEIVQTADGHAALVTFADRNAARPASMPPMPGVLIVEQEPPLPVE